MQKSIIEDIMDRVGGRNTVKAAKELQRPQKLIKRK